MKVMNQIVLWDAEFAWYSPSATHRICLYNLYNWPKRFEYNNEDEVQIF